MIERKGEKKKVIEKRVLERMSDREKESKKVLKS